jgi:hypothetical protein
MTTTKNDTFLEITEALDFEPVIPCEGKYHHTDEPAKYYTAYYCPDRVYVFRAFRCETCWQRILNNKRGIWCNPVTGGCGKNHPGDAVQFYEILDVIR